MSLPGSWSEVFDRFRQLVANDHDGPEWVAQAVRTKWGCESMAELSRLERTLAFQKVSGALLWIEDNQPEDLAFMDSRSFVAGAFARYFDGIMVEGPPWRLHPSEIDRLPYVLWSAQAASFF